MIPFSRSIRARLAIAYGALTAIVLAATFGVAYWQVRLRLRAALDEDLREEAIEFATFFERGEQDRFAEAEESGFRARGRDSEDREFFFVRDASGRIVAGDAASCAPFDIEEAARLSPGVARLFDVRFPARGSPFREAILARTAPDGTRFYVQALRSLSPVRSALAGLRRALIAAAMAGSVLVAFGALFLGRIAFRPFAALVKDARTISAEDLSGRLRDPGTGDELARLTSILNDLLDRVAAGVATTRRFVHDTSHELRTPLASLRLSGEALLRMDPSPEARDLVAGDLEEIERLERLVDDLLALARAEGRLPKERAAPVEPAEIVRFVGERVRPLAEAADVALEVDAPPCGAITGDRDALVRLVWNLADNAIKHTPAKGRVSLRCRDERAALEIEVEDTGSGIAKEDLPHVFERFYRLRTGGDGRPAGTGLGLAIARAIARQHGGEVEIESEVGRGTRARVALPRTS